MTKNDIIRMAREAGLHLYVNDLTEEPYALVVERFANLVAAAERDKLQSAAEWCRMCERKGVFYGKATGDEANSPEVLGEG
jgi:hypothetical protein